MSVLPGAVTALYTVLCIALLWAWTVAAYEASVGAMTAPDAPRNPGVSAIFVPIALGLWALGASVPLLAAFGFRCALEAM